MENTVQTTHKRSKSSRFTPLNFKLLIISWLIIISGFGVNLMASTNNVQASLVPESLIGCNEYNGLQVVFRLKAPLGFPAGQVTNITLITYNNSTDLSMVTFHEMLNGLTGSRFKVPSDGARVYKVTGKFTYNTGSTQNVYDFEANYDYSDLSIQFGADPIIYTSFSTPEEITITNPKPFFTYRWYPTKENGNPDFSIILQTGVSYNARFGNGRKFFVEGFNNFGCKVSNYIKREFQAGELPENPEEVQFELAQDCELTQGANANPNIIRPYFINHKTRSDFNFIWIKTSDHEAYDIVRQDEGLLQLNLDSYVVNQALDLNQYSDGEEIYCVILNNNTYYESHKFEVFGTQLSYTLGNITFEDKFVFFKQAKLSNDPNITDPNVLFNGDEFNKRLYTYPNFTNLDLTFKNSKFVVLTNQKAFNRIVIQEISINNVTIDANINLFSENILASGCFMWGGIHLRDESALLAAPDENDGNLVTTIENANTGILASYSSNNFPLVEQVASLTFPFFNYLPQPPVEVVYASVSLNGTKFNNNYFHIYFQNATKDAVIKNCKFNCDSEKMLFPYEPKLINGELQHTITEACIVGYATYLQNYAIRNFYNRVENKTDIYSNSFKNALYGVIVPNTNFAAADDDDLTVEYNHFDDIELCAIRYVGQSYFTPSTYLIGNNKINFNQDKTRRSTLNYQIDNLESYWNDINGFIDVQPNFQTSNNISKYGLSTGRVIYDGNIIEGPIGVFINNHNDEVLDNNQSYTFGSPLPRANYFYSTSRNLASFHNNTIKISQELVGVSQSIGILAGRISYLNKNLIEGFDLGVVCDVPSLDIENNSFINNKTSIVFNPVTIGSTIAARTLNFKCNIFKTNNAANSIGIRVKNGCPALDFGHYQTSPSLSYSLGANVWPLSIGYERSLIPLDQNQDETDVNIGWISPSNWTSIVNENTSGTGQVNYFRYNNEFVGRVSPSFININLAQTRFSTLKAFTSANFPPSGPNYEPVCEGTAVTNEVYFPTSLISNNSGVGINPNTIIEVKASNCDVNINTNGPAGLSQVIVSDLLGRIVSTNSNINSKQFTLSTTPMQKGVYLIKVLDSDGKVYTTKIQR